MGMRRGGIVTGSLIKLRRQSRGRKRKTRYHAGASQLAAFRPNALKGRAKGHTGQPQITSFCHQSQLAVCAKVGQHKGTGGVSLQQGRQARAYIPPHKGAGKGGM